jgi:hypothetical protein
LHTSLLDPRGRAWLISDQLGERFAADVLVLEMVHVDLFDRGLDSGDGHNTDACCAAITRITPQLGLPGIKAAPVKPRRISGTVKRLPLDGYLTRDDISRWPHSIRQAGFYDREGRIRVLI